MDTVKEHFEQRGISPRRDHPGATRAAVPNRAGPSIIVIDAAPAGAITAVSTGPAVGKEAFAAVTAGMSRADVETLVGPPHGKTSIQDSTGLVESLTYNVEGSVSPAKIRLEGGKVVKIALP